MIQIETRPDSTVVCRPLGDLHLEASMEFRHVIGDLLEPELNIVIDLSRVESIDAVGVSALVGSLRRVRALRGVARIERANPRVLWFLRLVGVDRIVGRAPLSSRPGVA
jgi:anti-anti-sigma factor